MKPSNVYLDKRQYEKLTEQAEREGVSVAALVRRAVDAFLLWYDPTYLDMPHSNAPAGLALLRSAERKYQPSPPQSACFAVKM